MLPNHKKAVLFGETKHCIQCAEHLSNSGWKIICIVSEDKEVISWSKNNSITAIPFTQLNLIAENDFYLFSIINPHLIPDSFLVNNKVKLALNYHDSLLPKYAGVNSTTWAIINGEKQHGTTLHKVVTGIDEGDIAAQTVIDLEKDETAISLNLKCSESLLSQFREVVTRLEEGTLAFSKQNLADKSYYGLKSIPANYAIVNGTKDMAVLDRLARGLTFGEDYDNPVASVKVWLDNRFYILEGNKSLELTLTSLDINKDTILFDEAKDIYGNKTDITITYQNILTPYILSADDLKYLSKIKASERKTKEQILRFFDNHPEAVLKILSGISSSNDLNYTREVKANDSNNLSASILLTLINFILIRFFRDDFVISLYLSDKNIPHNLRALVDKRNFICAQQEILNNGFSNLEQHLNQTQNTSYVITKDFGYRYHINMLTDIAIVMGELEYANHIDQHKIVMVIKDGSVELYSNDFYQMQVDSITEVLITLLSRDLQEEIIQKDLRHINLLNKEQYQQVVYELNKTEKDCPQDKTIHQLFEEQVLRTPGNIAIVYENKKLTYQELNSRTNQLAHYIKKNYQIQPDDLVALCLDRNEYMIIAMLGVLKSGGAYVPIDPNYPDERIGHVLDDTSTKVVLTNDTYKNKLRQIINQLGKNIHVMTIDNEALKIELVNQKNTSPITSTTNSNLVYVIYTSGTTGKPKGVMIEHGSLVNFVNYVSQFIKAKDIMTNYINYSFDAINTEIYPSLLNGNMLHILSDNLRTTLDELYQYIIENNITFIVLPSIIAAEFSLNYDFSVTKLRIMIVGGEVYKGRLNQISIINQYGPTETTVCATLHQYMINDVFANIGKPIAGVSCYVLDKHLEALPIGVIGELFIGGRGLARGYLNAPDLMTEKFIVNPFQTEKEKAKNINGRLYKTGDLVRMLPDGNFEYIGRNDNQVKIRGFRIELGEIETKLLNHPNIKQAVVLEKEHTMDQTSSKHLVAYYVSDKKLEKTEIQSYLLTQLPEHMIPQAFIYLEYLPLTINGKLDKKALPYKGVFEEEIEKPKNELEQIMCNMYANTLNLPIEQIGIKTDFFITGGDSISSIRLASMIRSELCLHVSVKDIFKHRTIEMLIKNTLNKTKKQRASKIKNELNPIGKSQLLPIQEWFLGNIKDGYHKKYNHWNQYFIVKTPELDINILKLSIEKLLQHHDAFRFRFEDFEKSYFQIAHPEGIFNLETINISGFSEQEIKEMLIEMQSNFNIETGPLYKIAYLYGYEDKTARLFFAMHHLIVDSVSWRILTQDTSKLYELLQDQRNTNKTSQDLLGQKTTSYRQWSEEINKYKPTKRELSYWESITKDYAKDYAVDINPAENNKKTHSSFLISQYLTKKLLMDVNKKYHTKIDDILLSSLARTLHHTFGQTINYVTLEGHGREEIKKKIDITRTVGWFTTMYPVRLVNKHDISTLIKTTKKTLRRIPKKGLGYGPIKGYKNLPNTSFNYLGRTNDTNNFWSIVDHALSTDPSNQNNNILDIHGYIRNNELEFHISLNNKTCTAESFANKFRSNLEYIIDHCVGDTKTELSYKEFGLKKNVLFAVWKAIQQNDNKTKEIINLLKKTKEDTNIKQLFNPTVTFDKFFDKLKSTSLVRICSIKKSLNIKKNEQTIRLTQTDKDNIYDYINYKEMSCVLCAGNIQNKLFTIASNNNKKSDVFCMASVGKILTGLLMFKLLYEGIFTEDFFNKRAHLDRKILSLLPNNIQKRLKYVTPLHLMTHKSGLGDYADKYQEDIHIRSKKGLKPITNLKELLQFIENKVYPINKKHYSNAGMLILGFVVEYAYQTQSKKYFDYNSILKKHLIDEIGITSFATKMPTLKSKYNIEDSITTKYWISSPAGAGNWINIQDLTKLAKWMYNEYHNNIKFRSFLEKYGEEFYDKNSNVIEHNGSIGFSSADFFLSFTTGNFVAALSNQPTVAEEIKCAILEYFG